MAPHHPEQLLLAEVQVLLAEKRTYLAIWRTGLATMTAPLGIIVFLVATASYHRLFEVVWLAAILLSGLLALFLGGIWLSYKAREKIGKIDRLVHNIRHENKRVAEIVV